MRISNRKRLLYTTLCGFATLLTLLLWKYTPIFPDEIATRMILWSFNYKDNSLLSLFSLCKNSSKEIPIIFLLPAKMLHYLNQVLSVTQSRIIPVILVTTLACITAWYAQENENFAGLSLMICAAYVGLSGSSLVMLRSETAAYLNIIFCIMGALILTKKTPTFFQRTSTLLALLFTSLLSVYYHPEGLLYLPLSMFISFNLLPYSNSKPLLLIKLTLCAGVFGLIGWHGLQQLNTNCENLPKLQAVLRNLAPNISSLMELFDLKSIPHFLYEKFIRYADAFIYRGNYDIGYIPSVKISYLLNCVNLTINLILMSTIGLCIFLFAYFIIQSTVTIFYEKRFDTRKNFDKIIFCLIFVPTIFLPVYDENLNFYRSHFIQFLLVISLIIGASQLHNKNIIKVFQLYTIIVTLVFVTTSIINFQKFSIKLKKHEGPSTPLRAYKKTRKDIAAVSSNCIKDKSNDIIIVDDLTYDSFRSWATVYPITYLHLQMNYADISAEQVLDQLKPNYIIGRCSSLEPAKIGWPPDYREGNICCSIPVQK